MDGVMLWVLFVKVGVIGGVMLLYEYIVGCSFPFVISLWLIFYLWSLSEWVVGRSFAIYVLVVCITLL